MDDDAIRAAGEAEIQSMRVLGLDPAHAARRILQGINDQQWRILIGTDTEALDALVRASPERAYDADFVHRWRAAHHAIAGD